MAVEKGTEKGTLLVNMDSQAPNRVFGEFVAEGKLWPNLKEIRPEYTWGDSRFDFRLEDENGPIFVEVKGVTLENEGVVRFPDAPTQRGVKHLCGLKRAVEEGYRAAVFFVIQMENVDSFFPNDITHPAFGEALRRAAQAGVEIRAFECRVGYDSLTISKEVPVVL